MIQSNNLFNDFNLSSNSPLADKLRPKSLDEFYGQRNLLCDDSLLRNDILKDKITN